MEASIIVTYRCPMRCSMCNIWKNQTEIDREFSPALLNRLPQLDLVNLTGGEPFVREDLEDIIKILLTKTKRIVISTSGWFQQRILDMADRFPDLGFRISIEGLSQKNDELRGRPGGFDKGLRTLIALKRKGIKDIGFGITVSNSNSHDMLWLYELSKELELQFATAAFHNSFYFHKYDNEITEPDTVCDNFTELINRLMKENHPKSWFRAFFNMGLINYIRGHSRLLPCEAGSANFFVDPNGDVLPCNGMHQKQSMGNLEDFPDFMSLWNSDHANHVRNAVQRCDRNCWMIGSASPVMKKYICRIAPWVIRHKARSLLGKRISEHDCPETIISKERSL